MNVSLPTKGTTITAGMYCMSFAKYPPGTVACCALSESRRVVGKLSRDRNIAPRFIASFTLWGFYHERKHSSNRAVRCIVERPYPSVLRFDVTNCLKAKYFKPAPSRFVTALHSYHPALHKNPCNCPSSLRVSLLPLFPLKPTPP